jgi:hypothetical protein
MISIGVGARHQDNCDGVSKNHRLEPFFSSQPCINTSLLLAYAGTSNAEPDELPAGREGDGNGAPPDIDDDDDDEVDADTCGLLALYKLLLLVLAALALGGAPVGRGLAT